MCVTNYFIHVRYFFLPFIIPGKRNAKEIRKISFKACGINALGKLKRKRPITDYISSERIKRSENKTKRKLENSKLYTCAVCTKDQTMRMHVGNETNPKRHAIDTYCEMLVLLFVLPENGKTNINCCFLSIVEDSNASST